MSKYTATQLASKPAVFHSLVTAFNQVPDQRSNQGKRFSLSLILSSVLLGFLKGKKSIEACVNFAIARRKRFAKWFDLRCGLPHATTVSRALAVTHPRDVIRCVTSFVQSLDGTVIEKGISMDGKTIRAISMLKEGCKHFISLFSHSTCHILDQEGVASKENEITASPRLLARTCLLGSMLTADALLTQTRVTKAVRAAGADYLFIVKDNHPDLQQILRPTFTDPLTTVTTGVFREKRKTRLLETTVTVANDLDLGDLHQAGWTVIARVGKLERTGKRRNKGNLTHINETVFFITSREDITPKAAYDFIRHHWHIENKLHWQKDVTWAEDRSRARIKHTPSILSYLRSFALECIKRHYESVTDAIELFTEQPEHYFRLLTKVHII